MRSFDIWDRYYDNQSKPLRGCVQFMVKDGNTSAPIYDQDGTELDNPQITDAYGRTEHQVFINEDVTAYFYKYIGTGTLEEEQELGIDTSDVSKWALQYTAENQQSYNTHVTSDAAKCVPTISALRALEVDSVPEVAGAIEITLLGYNAVGDKEPINYTWASGSTAADNGGSVIKCDDLITGRWIMTQPTEHCDTRHFGAFPQNSYNCPDQSYQIGQCCVYCMLHGLRPFFNGSMDYRWFKYSNLNVVVDAFDVTEDTRFYDAGNNTFQGDWNGNPRFTLGNTNVVGAKNIKTSWNAKSYTGYKNVIIDQQTTQKNWQDAHIDVQISPLFGYNFTHCTFEPNGNLGSDNANGINNTFNNCILNEKMFITDGEYAASLVNLCTNCQYTLDNFKNALYLYKQIRCTSDPNPYFDYQDLAPGLPWSMYQGNKITSTALSVCHMKNPITEFDFLSLSNQVNSFILSDVTGYYGFPVNSTVYVKDSQVKIALTQGCAYIFENSTVTLDSNAPAAGVTITLLNSTISGEANVEYTLINLSARESNINCKFDVTGVGAYYRTAMSGDQQCAYADVMDCNIGCTFTLYGMTGEQIDVPQYNSEGTQVATYPVTRYVNGNFKGNFVSGQIVLGITDYANPHYTLNWLARGLSITDNTGLSQNPITINRGIATQYDNYNIYTYKNNTGTMEFKNEGIALTLNQDDTQPGLRKMWEQSGYYVYTPYNMDDAYVFQMNLFTIGTINVTKAVIQIIHNSMMANAGASYGVTSPCYSNKDYGTPPYYGMRKSTGPEPWLWNIRNLPIAGGMSALGYGESLKFDAVQI